MIDSKTLRKKQKRKKISNEPLLDACDNFSTELLYENGTEGMSTDTFGEKWHTRRKKYGSMAINIESGIYPSKGIKPTTLTFAGHSHYGENDNIGSMVLYLWQTTDRVFIPHVYEILKKYSTIQTINIFGCNTAKPGEISLNLPLSERFNQRIPEESFWAKKYLKKISGLSYCEEFILKLKEYFKLQGESLPSGLEVIGAAGKVAPNSKGEASASVKKVFPVIEDYMTKDERRGLLKFNADLFISAYKGLCNTLDSKPKKLLFSKIESLEDIGFSELENSSDSNSETLDSEKDVSNLISKNTSTNPFSLLMDL